ncbi:MAG: lipopolysaccharide biosynthesis protein [bacterium]
MSIRKSLTFGFIYTGLAKYSNLIINIIIGAVLARLLTPNEFGIVALVTVFVSFFSLLSNFGLAPAVVQNNSLSKNDIRSIFSFSILIGFIFATIFYLGAPLIASFYNEPKLVTVSKLLSISVLFHSLEIIPKALFQKALKFKQIGIITVSVQLFSGIIAVILALKNFSYYALVYRSILVGLISLVIFYWLAPIKLNFKIEITSIKKIIKFSSFNFMFNLINYFSRNVDNILIGKFFNPAALGFYDKAYQLMRMPVQNLTHVISPVLMPVLSKYQDDEEVVYNTYKKIVQILATIGFPLSIYLYFSASEIINIIYGPQWDQSIPVFKLFALSIGFQMINAIGGAIYQAINRTDLLFYFGLINSISMIGGILYGILIGKSLEAVGYGLFFAFILSFFLGFYFLISKALSRSLYLFLPLFKIPIILSVSVFLSLHLISNFPINSIILSAILKLLTAVITFVIVFSLFKSNRELLRRELKKKKYKNEV